MSRLTTWWRYARTHGLRAASRAFCRRWVYRTYRCVVTHGTHESATGPPVADQVGDIQYRVAIPSDYERLHELERHGLGESTRRYAEQEHDWLFVAYHRDRIVATRRTSRVMRDDVVSRIIKLGPGQYWGADLFCLPEYRNRGIGRHLKIFGDRHMASLGYKEFYSTVSPSNTASLRASRAAGREAVYYVSYVKVLFWERLHVSTDVPQHFWDG